MSEADTPQEPNQSQSLPEPSVPIDASVADGTDGASRENKLEDKRLDSEDTAQPAQPATTIEVATDISADVTDRETTLSTSATTTAATTNNTAITPVQQNNWLDLIQKLRGRNRGLLNRVNQLEQALNESQEALQSQKAKIQVQDARIAKASQEIITFQEQTTLLFRELESSHQVAQRQQILIETLTEQLESSQERMAQMERECALTQQRYNEQSHLLLQTEDTVRELRDRLHRQQRHTLQFKAALEKCLEVSAINYEANTEAVHSSLSICQEDYLNSILATPGVLPKAQPIQPWSAQPELQADDSSLMQRQEAEQLTRGSFGEHDSPVGESLVIGPWSANNDAGQMTTSDFQFQPDVEEMPSYQTHEASGEYDSDSLMTVLSITEPELSQPLQDGLPDLAWLSQELDEPEADLSPEPATAWVDDSVSELYLNENSQDVETPDVSSLTLQDVPQPEVTGAEAVVSLGDWTMRPVTDTDPKDPPVETLDVTSLQLSQPSWPSPVVYPLRPSRGRKSLAAVELPTFPRMSGQQSSQSQSEEPEESEE